MGTDVTAPTCKCVYSASGACVRSGCALHDLCLCYELTVSEQPCPWCTTMKALSLDEARWVAIYQTRERGIIEAKLERARELIPDWRKARGSAIAQPTKDQCARELETALK